MHTFSSGDGELSCCYSYTTLTEPVPILRLSQTSCQLRVASSEFPGLISGVWLICKPLLHWVLFMSFSCILWHFQHMLCHNKKPHLTLSYPLYLFSPLFTLPSPLFLRIINAVILCIFNSITSALPHCKWTSLPLTLSLSLIGAHHHRVSGMSGPNSFCFFMR